MEKSTAGAGDQTSSASYKRACVLSILCLGVMVISSVVLDQATKVHAEQELMVWQDETNISLYQGRRYPIVSFGSRDEGNFYLAFNTNYVRNQGAAWGVFSDVDDRIRIPFFYGVTLLAVIVISIYLYTTPPSHRLARFGLALILSGAIGNFFDRLRLGFVIDWIDVSWNLMGWRYNFPNFNIADSAITVGVSFLMVDLLILDVLRKKEPQVSAAHPATGNSTEVGA